MLTSNSAEETREEVLEYFLCTFNRYELLFETLTCKKAYFEKSIPLRHPLIFYLGHTATFFINKLLLAGLVPERVNPQYESLFAVGVDEMSWDDLNDIHYAWPSVDEVMAYRGKVRNIVEEAIRSAAFALPINWNNPWWVIVMCIEHERIHLETSSVLIRQHVLEYVKPHPAWQPCRKSGDAPQNELIPIPAVE